MTQKTQSDSLTAEELFRDAELREERARFSRCLQEPVDRREQRRSSEFSQSWKLLRCRGVDVRKDLREAARWYKRAYRNGVSAGALNLSVDLENQGNTRGAIAWLKRAVAMNDGEAHVRLAKIYLKKRNGTETASNLLKQAVLLSPSYISDVEEMRQRHC